MGVVFWVAVFMVAIIGGTAAGFLVQNRKNEKDYLEALRLEQAWREERGIES